MKVLVNCYACSPYKGSEPGMGWNFVRQIALRHETHILVDCKFHDDIERYLEEHPTERANKHFYFIPKTRHRKLRKIWPPSYYWFYRQWQQRAYQKAVELDAVEHFDLIHQLNMVGYREPGYLWKIDRPMVWGPIGGFNITPWCMLPSMGLRGCVFYLCRNLINLRQMHMMRRVRLAMSHATRLIAATRNESVTIKQLYHRDSDIIPEVGYYGGAEDFAPHGRTGRLKIAWSGQFTPGKSLNLLIEACLQTKFQVELHILGDGDKRKQWKKMAERLTDTPVHWYGWVERSRGMEIMRGCDVFCITSLSDLTSTVLLEALSFGLPVIALDHCGFSNVITDECGIKIPIHSKSQVVRDIAAAIDRIASDEDMRQCMSTAANRRAQQYSWEAKGHQIDRIYKEAVR